MAKIYAEVKGCNVQIKNMGSVDELTKLAYDAKNNGVRSRFWEYIGYFYVLFTVDGTFTFDKLDNEKLGVKGTLLRDYLESRSDIQEIERRIRIPIEVLNFPI